MSQGRAPLWASSTILCRVLSGRGRPLTNTPPSWFTPLWPVWTDRHMWLKTVVTFKLDGNEKQYTRWLQRVTYRVSQNFFYHVVTTSDYAYT